MTKGLQPRVPLSSFTVDVEWTGKLQTRINQCGEFSSRQSGVWHCTCCQSLQSLMFVEWIVSGDCGSTSCWMADCFPTQQEVSELTTSKHKQLDSELHSVAGSEESLLLCSLSRACDCHEANCQPNQSLNGQANDSSG